MWLWMTGGLAEAAVHGWVPSVTFSLRKAAANLLLDPASLPALLPAV